MSVGERGGYTNTDVGMKEQMKKKETGEEVEIRKVSNKQSNHRCRRRKGGKRGKHCGGKSTKAKRQTVGKNVNRRRNKNTKGLFKKYLQDVAKNLLCFTEFYFCFQISLCDEHSGMDIPVFTHIWNILNKLKHVCLCLLCLFPLPG